MKSVNIGKAACVEDRLRFLQTGSPDKLIVLAVIESESDDHLYHRKFATDWVWGEWFRPSDSLMAFVLQVPSSPHCGLSVALGNRTASGEPRKATRDKAHAARESRRAAGQLRRDRPSRPAKVVDLRSACIELRQGKSLRKVARTLGMSHSSLKELMDRAGLTSGFDY